MDRESYKVIVGDCLEVMRVLPDSSVDAIVTDPPYGLNFMGKKWDYDVPGVEIWCECLRVLKPGGHLLAFAGTRTQHRMAVRIEDAGFEIRDMIAWVYSTGFPKSHNLDRERGKSICACSGGPQQKPQTCGAWPLCGGCGLPVVPAGFGTALKPALEPITVARKPLIGTVAENVLRHGTGALNVDGCRVAGTVPRTVQGQSVRAGEVYGADQREQRVFEPHGGGRWPANLIHDGGEECVDLLKDAARFFYCAKASKSDRDEGCEGLEAKSRLEDVGNKWTTVDYRDGHSRDVMARNHHPTVKPTDLMRYLCRLVTPPGGLVLDPFTGSGSTGRGAILEGFRFLGIERDPEYVKIAEARICASYKSKSEELL